MSEEPKPEDRWRRENDEVEAAVQKRARGHKGQSHHDLLLGGMGFQMAGEAGTNLFEKAIGADWELEHTFARITGHDNIVHNQEDPDLVKHIREQVQSVTRNTPGITQNDVAEIFQDLMTAFGDPKEALGELPTFAKLVNSLQMGDMHHGGQGDMHQALALARFIEDQGGAIKPDTGLYDPQAFDKIAQKSVSEAFATNFQYRPTEMLAMMKMARTGGMLMDDHALHEETPYFAQQFGASKLGTAIFSDVQVMLANRMTKKTADELGYYGLYGGKHWVGEGKKRHLEWDQGTLINEDMLKHDPYEWIHDVLGKKIADKLKVDDKTKEGQEKVIMTMTELAQRNTIAGLWADVYRNYGTAQKEGRNIAAQNPDMQQHMLQNDPMAQIKVFQASENELMIAIGDLVKGPAVGMLKDLIAELHDLTDWIGWASPRGAEG